MQLTIPGILGSLLGLRDTSAYLVCYTLSEGTKGQPMYLDWQGNMGYRSYQGAVLRTPQEQEAMLDLCIQRNLLPHFTEADEQPIPGA